MDRELVALAGAGLQVVAGGLGVAVPDGSIVRGYDFIAHLLSFGDSGLKGLIVAITEDFWAGWRRSGLPRVVAAEHIQALPLILEANRIDSRLVMGVIAKANAWPAATDAEEHAIALSAGLRLVGHVIDEAAKAGAFNQTGLSQQLCFVILERLFGQIIAERQILRSLRGVIVQYYAELERGPSEPGSAFLPGPGEPAEAALTSLAD